MAARREWNDPSLGPDYEQGVSSRSGRPSNLDVPVFWTQFFSAAAQRKREHRESLRQIEARIHAAHADSKHKLPLAKFTGFGNQRSEKGSYRTNANMLYVTGCEADYDKERHRPEPVVARLSEEKICSLVYTTPKHTTQKPRWRVFAPFSQQYPVADRARFLSWLNGKKLLDGLLEPESFTPSLSFFYGNVDGGTPVQTWLIEGDWIDQRPDLAAGSIGKRGEDLIGIPRASAGKKVDLSPEDFEAVVMALDNHGNDFETRTQWRDVGFAIHHQFDGSEEGFRIFDAFSAQWPGYDPDYTRATWETMGGSSSDRLKTGAFILMLAKAKGVWQQPQVDPDEAFEVETLPEGTDSRQPASRQQADDDEDLIGISWTERLTYNPKTGAVLPTMPNIRMILEHDRPFAGILAYNAFTQNAVIRKPIILDGAPKLPVLDEANGDLWEDRHTNIVRLRLERSPDGWGVRGADRDLQAAIDLVAQDHPFHPVRDYLNGLTWDGTPRLETLWIDYLGAENNPYHRESAAKFCIAAVTRAFEPGHKFDFAPIFEGLQGKRKSTFIRILAVDWFDELKGNFHDVKSMVEQMAGAWIMELPELSSLSRSTIEDTKQFVAANSSTIRQAYARRATHHPRQCVFAGTTNKRQYLIDTTGNRRWWPIFTHVELIDTDRLLAERNQLWAEATARYRAMREVQPKGTLPLHLIGLEAQRLSVKAQLGRRLDPELDAIAGLMAGWLDTPPESEFSDLEDLIGPALRTETCILEVWQTCLNEDGRPKRGDSLTIANAFHELGWVSDDKVSWFGKYGTQKLWRRPKVVKA